jgi:membrane protease subunit HflK
MINEARAEYNRLIPRAKGEALQAVLVAEGYGLDRVNRAEGESSRFRSIEEAYRRAPNVTRQRMYLETMERVMPRVGGKLFVDTDARGIIPMMPVDALRSAAAAATPAAGGAR